MPGLWYEDFKIGMVFEHEWTRTLTEADNKWFSLITMNPQPVHIDSHAAANSSWGRPLINSLLTLGCMVGMSVNDTTFGTTVANLGMSDVAFPHPLFEGDTIHIRTTVIDKRESKSRPEDGIVTLRHECFNQHGKLCGRCDRAALMRKRPKDGAQ